METSQLICTKLWLTGVYILRTLTCNEFKHVQVYDNLLDRKIQLFAVYVSFRSLCLQFLGKMSLPVISILKGSVKKRSHQNHLRLVSKVETSWLKSRNALEFKNVFYIKIKLYRMEENKTQWWTFCYKWSTKLN